MKLSLASIALAASLLGSTAAFAQVPAAAPTGSTALCNDGSYTSTATKQGACRGHKGVKDWYGPDAKAAPASAASAKAAPPTAAASSSAKAPAETKAAASAASTAAPTGSTALCNDGSYTSTATKQGACAGHKGVKDWYGPDAKASPATAASAKAAPPTTAAPAPSANTAPAETKAAASAPSTVAAAGGGPGLVWVNTDAKIYHCPKTEFYGKTKQGTYMTEAAAKAAGNRAERGKSCFS